MDEEDEATMRMVALACASVCYGGISTIRDRGIEIMRLADRFVTYIQTGKRIKEREDG